MNSKLNNEELVKVITDMVREKLKDDKNKESIPVGVSNRHIHLSQEDLDILFGQNYKLNELKPLKQPGQFAASEVLTIAGPKGSISKVRVLGPVRAQTQVEISKTDSFLLGLKCPTRESADLKGSSDICVMGPKGSIVLKEKAIVAKRHIHMNDLDAQKFGVTNGEKVTVVSSGERKVAFGEVVVRVNPSYALEFHLDVDEANCAGLSSNDSVQIRNLLF